MSATDASEAFEYVTGTLRGEEREAFEKSLAMDLDLQLEVRFWEEQLMSLNASGSELQPGPKTWREIQKSLKGKNTPDMISSKHSWWTRSVRLWQLALVCSVLIIGLLTMKVVNTPIDLNADYVAVLTDNDGNSWLTAITASDGETLWLQWNPVEISEGRSFQLWAVSRRDAQSRSLVVFESESIGTDSLNKLTLSQTNLRLIRDSSYLLLTEEELGGSAIDEPSETVLAQGICVRLATTTSS